MNDFKAICRILKALSDAIDFEEFDASRISAESVASPPGSSTRYSDMRLLVKKGIQAGLL